MIKLHSLAFDKIKKTIGSTAKVGQIYFLFDFYPAGRNLQDIIACKFIDYIFNCRMLNKLYKKKKLDWLGINYYTRQIIKFNLKQPGFIGQEAGEGYSKTDMGWEIFPEGLKRVFRRLSKKLPAIPFHITECGLSDDDDSLRPDFIIDHINAVHELITEGVKIKSFTYWSSLDNWEWNEGWGPKFGLYAWDPDSLERKPRKSAELFRRIVKLNAIPEDHAVET